MISIAHVPGRRRVQERAEVFLVNSPPAHVVAPDRAIPVGFDASVEEVPRVVKQDLLELLDRLVRVGRGEDQVIPESKLLETLLGS